MKTKSLFYSLLSYAVALYIFIHGLLNVLRGNDPEYGVALILASFIFLPVTNRLLKHRTGYSIPAFAKVVLALLIIWTTLAVGAVNEGYYPEITG